MIGEPPDRSTVGRPAGPGDWRGHARRRLALAGSWVAGHEWLALAVLLSLAALLRLPGLEARGPFDADQGIEMVAMMRFAQEGTVPLLGPKVSIGEFHQGALYLIALTPIAALGGGDPTAVMLALALLGLAAIVVTWWLARSVAGPLVGLTAALLLAFSPAGIETSSHMWGPSPMPLFAALALAAAWRARLSGSARWWVVALASAGVVWQLHHVGVLMIVPVAALLGLELRAAGHGGDPTARRRVALGGVAGSGAIVALFAPLIVHELQTGFSEAQAIAAYLLADGETPTHDLLTRVAVIGLRAFSWPFNGLATEAPLTALLVAAIVVSVAVAAMLGARGEPRAAATWLVVTILFSIVALSIAAPSLSTVVTGLSNDHYHSFLLPAVIVVVALGLGRLSRRLPALGTGLLLVLLVASVGRWPAAAHADGGWPAARDAGASVVGLTGTQPVGLVSVPDFKSTDGIAYPIAYNGGVLAEVEEASFVVVVCDRLFEGVVGLPCAGPAEEAALSAKLDRLPALVDRFAVSERTWLSLYER